MHNYETEVGDWMATAAPDLVTHGQAPFDEVAAKAAGSNVTDQFLIQHQIASLALATS